MSLFRCEYGVSQTQSDRKFPVCPVTAQADRLVCVPEAVVPIAKVLCLPVLKFKFTTICATGSWKLSKKTGSMLSYHK
ncbi:unnamed protein product [Peronospora belbahrii]|uniref:Uncharacterized protein n=1 Tax=Peronospora belbahrii TaxID=622444 RepID=A0AAU9L419_9STRA|nr:unnamed protein product [Peronospora belbahrii]